MDSSAAIRLRSITSGSAERGHERPSCRCQTRRPRPGGFGEAQAAIGGVRQEIHFSCLDLPQRACFVRAIIEEPPRFSWTVTSSALAFLERVPPCRFSLRDKIGAAKICGDGRRDRTRASTELISHSKYLVDALGSTLALVPSGASRRVMARTLMLVDDDHRHLVDHHVPVYGVENGGPVR